MKANRFTLKFRINVLFVFVFTLFALLILRLGVVQVAHGNEYEQKVNEKQNKIVEISVPRGRILDRNGETIVTNTPIYAITYTRPVGASQQDHLKIATELAKYINKETMGVTERDMKDYWILTRPNEAANKFEQEELKSLSDEELYELQLKRISGSDLKGISDQELEIIAIKRELDQAASLTEHTIDRENVTNEEVALVNSHLSQLPFINTKVDWKRKYNDGLLSSVIGNISSPEKGLPSDNLDFYLSRGYSRNDRVGTSFIEQEYEDVLQGKKKEILFKYSKDGEIIENREVEAGRNGYDLLLTIDKELQSKVENIIEDELIKAKTTFPEANKYLDSAYALLMDPRTGEILSMAGKRMQKDKFGQFLFSDMSVGNVLFSYPMGSAVKAATVLTGYETDTIEPGEFFFDEPIKIRNTPIKKSYKNLGNVNDLDAIKLSSNVYMWKLAMKMGEYDYGYNQAAEFKNPAAFDDMRYYFSQFGLGVPTQIDLPYEATGYTGSGRKIGFLMDLAIGQYDTYTPLQLLQYIATIANDGYRIKPHLLKQIIDPAANKVLHLETPSVLNKIDMKEENIKRVQNALHKVAMEAGGTAYPYFIDAPYEVAAKTGTAEIYHSSSNNLYNLTLVGYAPFENPTVSFAVVVPYATEDYGINKYIARKILDAYFGIDEKEEDK